MSLWKKHHPDSKLFSSDQRIETWLKQRQDLHNQFCRILKFKPFDDENDDIDLSLIQDFCSNLVDYVSAGHFEIFECLSVSHKVQQKFSNYKPLLEQISATVISFAKKYSHEPYNSKNLKTDMSKLGEDLFATRMEKEDDLINCYLTETAEVTGGSVRKSR